ncbi:hypothetical protein LCGC14_3097750, partial [marine sediment metagenome]
MNGAGVLIYRTTEGAAHPTDDSSDKQRGG